MPAYDPTDLRSQALAKEFEDHRKQLAQTIAAEDVKWLMGDMRGRRLMWDWLASTGLHHQSFTGEASTTFFNEGKRNIGLKLQAQILTHCPEKYLEMQMEAKSRAEATPDA
jgi:hypothetical protein